MQSVWLSFYFTSSTIHELLTYQSTTLTITTLYVIGLELRFYIFSMIEWTSLQKSSRNEHLMVSVSFTTSTVSLHLKLKHWNIHVFTSTNYFLYFLRNNRLWFIVLKKLTGLKLHDQVLTSLSIGRNHQQFKINQRLPEIIMMMSDLTFHIRWLGYFFYLTYWYINNNSLTFTYSLRSIH